MSECPWCVCPKGTCEDEAAARADERAKVLNVIAGVIGKYRVALYETGQATAELAVYEVWRRIDAALKPEVT